MAATQGFGVIPQEEYEELTGYRVTSASSTAGFSKVEDGDFVIILRTFQGGIELSRATGCVSPAYTVMTPTDRVVEGYFRHLLKSDAFLSVLGTAVTGVRDGKSVRYKDFSQLVLPIPPKPSQHRIADFLDRETAHIDRLIEKKQRLISLLEEKRSALITRAVTKGLDSDVPMKDSGVEWIGEIPEHWEARRTWSLATVSGGATPSKENRAFWDGDIPWVSPKDMKRRRIESSQDCVTEEAVSDTGIHMNPPSAVLIVVRGMILQHSFPVAVTAVPVTINQDMKALTMNEEVIPSFMEWSLTGLAQGIVQTVVDQASHGTKAIRMDRLRSLVVPLPSRVEQDELVETLDGKTAEIDAVVSKTEQGIALLKERRSALITAAVTGQIDVDEYAASHTAPLADTELEVEADELMASASDPAG